MCGPFTPRTIDIKWYYVHPASTDLANSSVTANIADKAEKDQLIVGAKHGFARLNQTTGKLSYIAQPWEKDETKQYL